MNCHLDFFALCLSPLCFSFSFYFYFFLFFFLFFWGEGGDGWHDTVSVLCIVVVLFSNSPGISRVSDQNGVSLLHIMLEIHHSGREHSICFALLGVCMVTYIYLAVRLSVTGQLIGLLETLGTLSMTARELKQLISLFKMDEEGKQVGFPWFSVCECAYFYMSFAGAGIAQLVVLGLAVHSVAGSILLWGHFR